MRAYDMPDGQLPDHLPGPEDVPRILSRADALARGYTRHAIQHHLDRRLWHLVLPRTYLTGNTLTWSDRLAAALSFAGRDALLTGAAALADLGLRCVPRPESVLLLVPRSNHVRPAGWVRLRRADRVPSPAFWPGPRRADLPRAVADLALELRNLDDVRTLVAQARRAGLCTLDELQTELRTGPRRGSAHLRQALADAMAGAESAPEARAAAILGRASIPPFKQNGIIRFPDGTRLRVDFLWRELRAVLEIDSDEYHNQSPADRDRTDIRHTKLITHGISVMTRRPGLIDRAPAQFARDVEAWLAARAIELAKRDA